MNRQTNELELRSPLPPAECARRINAAIDGWDEQFRSHGARGAADATGFRIQRNARLFRQSIMVFMDADFEPDGGGTRLSCSFDAPYATGLRKILFAGALLLAIFSAFAALQQPAPDWSMIARLLAFAAVMTLVALIQPLGIRYDREVLTELVRTALEKDR